MAFYQKLELQLVNTAVQLAKRRGAMMIALASAIKADAVCALGADQVLDRNADLLAALGENSMDVVIDLVGGAQCPTFLKLLRPGG